MATVARRLENARRKAEEFSVPAYYDDYQAMMDRERPDAVVVTTPHSVHAEVCLAAFERGIHVLNEKPMATRWEDCVAMVRAADRAGVVYMQLPYDNTGSILTAQRLLREEIVGKLTGAEACLNIPGPPRDNWYYDRSIAHGGAMLDCMVYPISRLISLLGRAERVTGLVNTLIPNRIVGGGKRVLSDVDDNVALLIEFAEGQVAVVRSLWGTAFVENSTTVFGREGTIVLPGDGRVLLQRRDGTAPIPSAQPDEWRSWKGVFRVSRRPESGKHDGALCPVYPRGGRTDLFRSATAPRPRDSVPGLPVRRDGRDAPLGVRLSPLVPAGPGAVRHEVGLHLSAGFVKGQRPPY
ncbi:MAG: hypothetical protein KatS3mg115_0009 [Candidatus Poribacteria bacterium]|nr:MAG: hypothetical protein KatS3mg115_0009 [Candidatus Poribacteria bacterium]